MQDARRPARQLSGAARVGRCRHGCDPAAEPPAEPQRLAARRRRQRRACGASSATSRRPGSMSSESVRWMDRGRAFLWAQRARRLAARLPRAARRRRRRRWSRASTPTSSTSLASTKRAAGSTSLRLPRTRRSAICIDRSSMARRARARDAGRQPGHARLRRRAGRDASRSTPIRASISRRRPTSSICRATGRCAR